MPEAVNPYIAGNPVTGTEMFFGRDDVFEFIQKTLTGQHRDNVIVLYGQRRTGKTSVMYQMSRHLSAHYLCIFIDMSGLAMEGLGGLLWELANYIQRTLKRDHQIELPRLSRNDFMTDPRGAFENDFLGHVWPAIGDRHILLMLDEAIRLQEQIRAGRLEKEVFEYLRHLMQAFDRLNFLFSLGSGLEEMEKEYAFLFSVGLYKKISFLERDAATALITQPVKDRYQVAPAAISRILQVTSGHAYYTQLLCHSLFNRWQQQRQPQVQAADVNAILDEVVERGLAVLKHVWEESTPGEKAVLAGLAACMGERNHPVGLAEVERVWAQHGVMLPPGEEARAIKGLLARDIIAGQDRYVFTVDLQRQWALKYERVEWVKEEIASDLAQWSREQVQPVAPAPAQGSRALWMAAIGVGLIIVAALVVYAFSVQKRASDAQMATSDAERAILQSRFETSEASNAVIRAALATRDAAANRPGAEATAAENQFRNVVATAHVKPAEITVVDATPLLDRINKLRAQNELAPYRASTALMTTALQHSQDMASTGYITQTGSDGSTAAQRARAAGYTAAVVVEDVFGGQSTLDETWVSWTNDPERRSNLLSNRFSDIGIGIATGGPLTYYTVDLGGQPATSAPTATPAPTATCDVQVLDTAPVRESSGLRLRKSRDISAAVVDSAAIGERLVVYERVAEADGTAWLLVRSPRNKQGWVRENQGDTLLVACVAQPPPTLTAAVGPASPMPTTPTPTPTWTWTPTPTPTGTRPPACTPPVCEASQVSYCPATCPNGCGIICATKTPTPTKSPTPTDTLTPTPTPTATPTPTLTNSISNFRVVSSSNEKLVFTVDYSYSGDHGDPAWLGAWPLEGGQFKIWYGYVPDMVHPGSGSVTLEISFCCNNPPASVTTDQIQINMYDGNGATFLTQVVDYSKTWTKSSVGQNLISNASFEQDPRTNETLWFVDTRGTDLTAEWSTKSRTGTHALALSASRYITPQGQPGWFTTHTIPIAQGQTYTFSVWSFTPDGAGAWVSADLLDANGQFLLGVSTGCPSSPSLGTWEMQSRTVSADYAPGATQVRLGLQQCMNFTEGKATTLYYDDVFFGIQSP